MVDPASIAAVSMVSSAAGTGLKVAGALAGGKASSEMYSYQAGVADLNAKIAKQNADWARSTGERDAMIFGMKAGQRQGQMEAAQGASGIDLASGSAKEVRESQTMVDRMDIEQIRTNAARKAYGHDIEAVSAKQKAAMYKSASSNAEKAGWIEAATSLVGGATSVSAKWLQGNDAGLWGGSDPLGEVDDWRWMGGYIG